MPSRLGKTDCRVSSYPAHGISVYRGHGKTVYLGPGNSGYYFQALLYGSLARGKAGADSDIDLLVVGEVSFEEVVESVARAQDSLRREINPMVMSLEEYRSRISKGDHLLDMILKSPYMLVIGDPHESGRVA